MKIVAADPMARVLSEDEVRALLREPIVMHLGLVDGKGWPVVNPVWHVFEDDFFRVVVGKTSHKATQLRANPAHTSPWTPAGPRSRRGASGGAPPCA